ncbi:MAG: methionyl-tRNA formyltransferase [Bacteroidaceae bacterium]|jgi:methionyl-tRNA formyltransferase|nr:methionyl-tRNA formyltransferase [Bacteroidaceae bacterium]
MKKEELRIVYMGTPDFAVESLRALVEGGYNVVGVVTMPDKPMGRHGSVLQPSPVKKYALEKGLTVLQPEKLKDETFLDELRALKADLQIVVAFRMLPEVVWNMPPMGTFNLHASLLPQYRGAAPINWAVINGETETGITTFFLKHEIDTGKIIQQVRVPIHETDNVEDVHDRLMLLGGQLVTETVDNILAGTIQPIDQSELVGADVELKPAPKIFHETCQINWNQPMKKVYDFIRGLSPYPAAWSEFEDAKGKKQSVKIFSTSMVERVFTASELMPKPGEMLTDGKTYLHVMCQNGLLSINELQMAGKKRMPIADFLRGFEMKERMAFIASDC